MKKGISLVALVITIIVLIILSATVILSFQEGGIIDKANQAVEDRNQAEVYSAIQREVLNVQTENIGLPIGNEFANKLKEKLNKSNSSANATASYNQEDDIIEIQYSANKKEYSFMLDNKYKLVIMDEAEKAGLSIDKEREQLQKVYTDYFPSGASSLEELEDKLPEGWSVVKDDYFFEGLGIVRSKEGNTFYVTGEGISIEKIGTDDPMWLITEDALLYLGNQKMIEIDDDYTISNIYRIVFTDGGVSSLEKTGETIKASEVDFINFSYSKTEEIILSVSTNIGYSFSGAINLKKVTMNSPITYIENFSNCTKLTEVNLSSVAQRIDKNAFNDCTSLREITIPASVTDIDNGAFSGCTLEKVYVTTEIIRQEAIDSGISESVIVPLY